jgi:hypothetical protein
MENKTFDQCFSHENGYTHTSKKILKFDIFDFGSLA